MKNLKLFLKSFVIVIFAVVFIITVTVSAAVVDTNTRKMTFGETEPALAAENYKDYTKVYFFGYTFNVYDSTVEQILKNFKRFFLNSLPSAYRVYNGIMKKINPDI